MDKHRAKTLTRAGLADAIHNKVGLSRAESARLIERILEEMSRSIVSGERVKISLFGTFLPRSKPQRIGRNPKTLEEVVIPPRSVLVFRASQLLRKRISEGVRDSTDDAS